MHGGRGAGEVGVGGEECPRGGEARGNRRATLKAEGQPRPSLNYLFSEEYSHSLSLRIFMSQDRMTPGQARTPPG